MKRKAEREEAHLNRIKKQTTDERKRQADSTESAEDDTDRAEDDTDSADDIIPESVKAKTTPKPDRQCQKMTISLPSLAKACHRTGVSDGRLLF